MFLRNSRYYNLDTVAVDNSRGEVVSAVKYRRLPDTQGQPMLVRDGMQLDVESKRRYKDPTRYWHIADANTELEANKLVENAGRVINVPEKP